MHFWVTNQLALAITSIEHFVYYNGVRSKRVFLTISNECPAHLVVVFRSNSASCPDRIHPFQQNHSPCFSGLRPPTTIMVVLITATEDMDAGVLCLPNFHEGCQGQRAARARSKKSTVHDFYVSPLQRGEAIHTHIDNSVLFLRRNLQTIQPKDELLLKIFCKWQTGSCQTASVLVPSCSHQNFLASQARNHLDIPTQISQTSSSFFPPTAKAVLLETKKTDSSRQFCRDAGLLIRSLEPSLPPYYHQHPD